MANCLLKEKEWSHIRIQNGISNTIKTNLPKNIFKWVKFQLIQQTEGNNGSHFHWKEEQW